MESKINNIWLLLLRHSQFNEGEKHEQISKISCDKSNIGVICRDQKSVPRSTSEIHLLEQVESAGRGKSKRRGRGHMNKGPETRRSMVCIRCASASPGSRYLKP